MALNSGITPLAGDSASAQILAARGAAKVKFEAERERQSTKVRAADAMMAAGSFREALSLYEPILDDAEEGCEQDISVYLNCASCYEHLEDWESLLEASTELLEKDKQRLQDQMPTTYLKWSKRAGNISKVCAIQ